LNIKFFKSLILSIVTLGGSHAHALDPPAEDSAKNAHWLFGGHGKYRLVYQSYPEISALRPALGGDTVDQALEARLTIAAKRGSWDFKADYQFIALRGESLQLAEVLPGTTLPVERVLSDERRWWDLTHASEGARSAYVNRLDRLSIGFTTQRTAWRLGRQAISWGNGMLFNPADVFNPFDPAAVDTEYKTGDDMLYGQFLFADGGDLQGVAVLRRDPRSGDVEQDQSSLALKYHDFLGPAEYDLLAAEHYGDRLLGLGGNLAIGGAVWRGDLTWTSTAREDVVSAVTSLGYSWTWGGRNVSGVLEYYHNGFGQSGGAYAPADLARNPDLLARLERGELHSLGRNYLGASATIELTPLFLLTPGLFVNLHDPSALAQLVARYDVGQELLLLCALNIPVGPVGSEYGGVPVAGGEQYLSTGPSLFAQLAWYF
jgi:hypothetical protein